ncbi:SH3 domain-binding protein 5-like [Ruditapes philippinarum]|uniref:SH3 domain-binding protein 5-like n=1 Tax=Ruditapes philippinarum TaxID=129788 RepID=UPI00295AC67D|nr:SH3 domain-binding protein 5-like [Ruditapes philippinarum]
MESSACTDMKTDNNPDSSSDDEHDQPDPRIQTELDKLNSASADINRLENELDEARSKYRIIVSGTSGQMEIIAKGRKKSIQKAREYYKLSLDAKLAQSEALKAARQFQTAVSVYKAARETVALAESRLTEDTGTTAAQLTSAWQEMLNHAIAKVTEAEKERAKSEQNHQRRSAKYAELQSQIQILEKKFARSIKKAKPYFELKAELDVKLMQQKQNVLDLQAAIRCCKMKYTESLRKLESISEEIHQSRREKIWSKVPRMPGVGADTDSMTSGISETDMKSMASCEWSDLGDDEFGSTTDDEVFDTQSEGQRETRANTDLQDRMEQLGFNDKLHAQLVNNNYKNDDNNERNTEVVEGHTEPDQCETSEELNVINENDVKSRVYHDTGNDVMSNDKPTLNSINTKLNDVTTCISEIDKTKSDKNEREEYTGCDMQSVERPSLSGEED